MEEQGEWGSQCQEITPADFAQCGYESNYKRCNRLNKCFWEGTSRTGTCVVDMTTDAPTTSEFATCGYETNYKTCGRMELCTWTGHNRYGSCVTTASITTTPTLTPTTDQPTTADFAQCGYESNHKLCKKLDRCFWKGNPRTGTCLVNRPTA